MRRRIPGTGICRRSFELPAELSRADVPDLREPHATGFDRDLDAVHVPLPDQAVRDRHDLMGRSQRVRRNERWLPAVRRADRLPHRRLVRRKHRRRSYGLKAGWGVYALVERKNQRSE